jgi:hypothetical protein
MATKKKVEAEKKPAVKKVVEKKAASVKKPVAKKASTTWPKVTVGSHLTVTEHEDGHTELKWDDDQLLKEVQEAIASVETKPKASAITGNIKEKKTRKTKSK